MDKFWMCYVEGKSAPIEQHSSLQEAQTEAERLASLQDNIGCKVFILEAGIFCQIVYPPVHWTVL